MAYSDDISTCFIAIANEDCVHTEPMIDFYIAMVEDALSKLQYTDEGTFKIPNGGINIMLNNYLTILKTAKCLVNTQCGLLDNSITRILKPLNDIGHALGSIVLP